MLQTDAVERTTLKLIYQLLNLDYLQDFVLVGGTALALQIGHRRSDDIDLFTASDFDQNSLLEKLEQEIGFTPDYIEKNTLKGNIKNVKIDILAHKYEYINEWIKEEGLRITSLEDIAAMKLNAISNDGTRVKDFIDLYYLIDHFSLAQLISLYESKYSSRNSFHVLKSINYFDDVELSEWPVMIQDMDLQWESVMKRIDVWCLEYSSGLLQDGLSDETNSS